MKFRLTIPPPRRASGTWLPAIACLLLLGLLGLQLAWERPIPLPAAEPVQPVRLAPVTIEPLRAARVIVERGLLGAGRGAVGPGSATVAGPLDGALPVGVMTRGGRALLFLQAPDGKVTGVGSGGLYHGWIVTGIGLHAVRVQRGAESHVLPIAAGHAAPAADTPGQ